MKDKTLFISWGLLALLCAGLGFIPEAAGFGKFLLMLCAFLFFLPPVVLILRGIRRGDRKPVLCVRLVSLCSLALTLVFTVLNLVSVNGSRLLGDLLYGVLGVVSVPMLCIRYWWLSLFLWGCLLTASLLYAPKKQQ